MRILTLLITTAVLVFGPFHSRAEILVKDGESVAFMGDSITQFGADQDGGYVRLVESGLADQGIKITVIPAGISTTTSRHMLGRLQSQVLSKKPAWMTLSCGVNDVMHTAVELEEYKANVTAILDQCQAAGVKVMLLTATQIGLPVTSPGNVKLAGYNDFLREIAKARNIPLADLNAAQVAEQAKYTEAKAERSLTGDGVHMNIYGNMVMAKGVLAAFGLTDAQLAALQEKWNKRPDVAPLPNGPTPRGDGTGLTGEYFADVDFKNLVATQIDVQLHNLQWGKGGPTNIDRTPMAGMPADNFSVRWTGQLQALEEGEYTIGVNTSDVAKVWLGDLNGPPLINKTADGGPGSNKRANLKMAAGQKYDIKIEYIETSGDADIQLLWTRPGVHFEVIRKTQLHPTTSTATAKP